MIELSDRSEPADIITLSECLKNRGELEAVGGSAYLASLNDFVPTAANIAYYARIVREKAVLRQRITPLNSLEIVERCLAGQLNGGHCGGQIQ